MYKSLTAALTCVVLLAVASPASAGIVPGVAVDGPSNQIDGAAPRVDVAPDGSAALVYLKLVGANLHPFVSTLEGGAWSAPVEVDPALAVTTSGARIAVANGGKVVVTYKKGAAGPLVAQVRPSAGAPFGASQDLAPAGTSAEIDLAGNGNGYAAGSSNNDVFAARLEGTTWTPVAPAVLDKDPLAEAGVGGNNEARIATAPDGASGVVTWAELVGGGPEADVFARRLTGANAGPVGAGAHIVTTLPGADPYGGMLLPSADQPDVDIDASGTAWVAFRQNITYSAAAKHRAFSRPFVGDAFGSAQLVDAMPEVPTEGRDLTRIDVNGAGQGLITHHGNLTNPFEFASLAGGTWTKGGLVEAASNAAVPQGSPALGENGSGLVTYNFKGGATEPIDQPGQDHARRARRRRRRSPIPPSATCPGRRTRRPDRVRSRRSPSCRCPEPRTARSSPRSSTCRSRPRRLRTAAPTPPPPTSPASGSAASASGSARRCRRRPRWAREP